MAPTELLAEQHAATLEQLLAPLDAPARAAPRPADRGREAGSARAAGRGPGPARGRHPCADAGERLVPAAGPGGHRRAAPLRGRAAGGAHRQGRRARCAAAHRHADPALARAHALRRSRRLHPPPPPAGTRHHPDRGPDRRAARAGARVRARGSCGRGGRATSCCRSSRSPSAPTCGRPPRWRRASPPDGPSSTSVWSTAGSRPKSATTSCAAFGPARCRCWWPRR